MNTDHLCSLRDNCIHDELGCEDAHHSSGRNVSEGKIATITASKPGTSMGSGRAVKALITVSKYV